MKKYFFFTVILSIFISCCVRQKRLVHHVSTLENVKILPLTKDDSTKIDSVKLYLKKTQETIDRGKRGAWICLEPKDNAEFRGGITLFRELIFEKFKVSTNTKEGENLFRVTIGKNNNLETIEFLKFTDDDSRKQIEDIFRLKALNNWSSAEIFGIPVNEEFEISIFIEEK